MTFDQMLRLARNPSATITELRDVAGHVAKLLGEEGEARVGIKVSRFGEIVSEHPLDCSSDVARKLAAVLLRLADEVDATSSTRAL